jgi:hypothetical protein
MSIAIIEINDCGLCCGNAQGEIFVSPGYALVTNQGITTGNAALEKAYLQPQQSFNQYWRQLNLSPLSSPTPQARHNADLAYAQLLQLHQESGSPEEIIFAAPGNFDRDQLSIVLGLAKASPFKTVGLVDSAVVAASQSNTSLTTKNQLLHLDIQLHQLVLTRLSVDNHIERTDVDVMTDIGLTTFYDNWARYIADQFIQQYRYDPLHTAQGEQQLYDSLPNWLEKINDHQELAVSLDSPQGSYRLNLDRNALLASNQGKLEQLQQKLDSLLGQNDTLIASHRTNLLPGLATQLGTVNTLPANAALFGCMENIDSIKGSEENIHFVTQIPNKKASSQSPINQKSSSSPKIEELDSKITPETQPEVKPTADRREPTHVLYQHRAQAIGDVLYLQQKEEGLSFSQQQTTDTGLFRENSQVYLRSEQINISAQNPTTPLQVGETINIGPHLLQLIEVT